MSPTVCYEQPLNERVRALLRVEFLFQHIDRSLAETSAWGSRAVLQGLFDLLSLTARNELKGDLLKELERQLALLNRLRTHPDVHFLALDQALKEIGAAIQQIHRLDGAAADAVRQTDFLNAVYKRSQAPGGACQFDVPALHHWLHQEPRLRVDHLREWLAPFIPLRDAAAVLLRLIRDSAVPQPEIACRGFFQRGLARDPPYQLIRVLLARGSAVFPEISGGRQRFSIHFLEQSDPNRRAVQSVDDIAFDLACCGI